jgi:antitoxin (DNA-binding transcriptional repressor) of toxin-antitoxin stability system
MDTVGVRKFREQLSIFLEATVPVAITRHGETIGFFIPARRTKKEADLDALERAGDQVAAMIAAVGTTEDDLVEDFKELRRRAKRSGR